ncbi:Chromosome partitioning ATPase, Mrp family, contains Fe-S cluster [Malonomonas rubra DSM 5091]|uniref:Iron-sulfur cluster carrier protein n=1 Tax=Malonomonas rubra DSM 5091 TaxID=1122189 RepID=A0A1M6I0F3_MALRU|nr:Mrp/NBP35 family ATP-binding protein [Malonomonas rubra]SHJ27840.1 Chromosome partitioning ATPase, Mrp family, contains Fe-S cluster [Malonomonas rubra DSM 5091]
MSSCDSCNDSSCSVKQPNAANDEQAQIQRNLAIRLCGIKNKLIVMSGKGGVGKSTTAVNLAYALVEKGFKVGLLDIDLHGPSVPTMCGLSGEHPQMDEEGILPMVVSGLKLMSIGFLLQSTNQATIMRGPMKHGAIMQLLADVNWGELDYLLIDCPPGTGDEPLSAVQLLGKNAAAVVVTTPQDVALVDVEKSLSFCNELKLPVVGLIENMSGFICPHCNKVSDIFKSGGGDKLAEKTGVAMLAKVPLDPRVVAAGDDGKPHILSCPDSKCSEALRQAADAVVAFDGV